MTSIETRTSWVIACTVLVIMSLAYGAPFITVVALKDMANELGSARSIPALAYSFAWLGMAIGGLAMGRVAQRFGVKWTVGVGGLMIGIGLAVSAGHSAWRLWLGHGLFIGLLGNAGINAPCYIYVSQWFDRRRGAALALISSGQYVAGSIWPPIFERGIALLGWRHTMLIFGAAVALIVVPLAVLMLRPPPQPIHAASARSEHDYRVLGMSPNLVLVLLAMAAFMCCVPMAMPQTQLVALCTDLGIAPSHGAAMLSVLLGSALLSRLFWGWAADRIGGLRTLLCGSVCQAIAMVGFLVTHNELGLFAVATFFGLGFGGMVPAYVFTVRELFPAVEAAWRVPTVLLFSGAGMAVGGWLAGFLYDQFGFYGAAFAAALVFNLGNLFIVGTLVLLQGQRLRPAIAVDGRSLQS